MSSAGMVSSALGVLSKLKRIRMHSARAASHGVVGSELIRTPAGHLVHATRLSSVAAIRSAVPGVRCPLLRTSWQFSVVRR
jgi:hypothetical protein